LETVCGLGACGCVASLLGPVSMLAAGQAEAPDQRLAFARYQVANLVRLMSEGPAAAACTEILGKTGRECSKLFGLAAKFKGDPEGYFAAIRKAWGTEFDWNKANGVITVTVGEGPCGCPLADSTRTPSFWCNCSVGNTEETFSTLFGRPVKASLQESKLGGSKRCVFAVRVGLQPVGRDGVGDRP
jgi:hypothetical protein